MAILDTINDFAKNVSEKTSGTLEATRLSARVAALNRVIGEAQQKIGAYYFNKLVDSGEEPDADIKMYFEQIKETQEDIDDMRKKISDIKAAQAEPFAPGKKLCANCGAVISVKAKYCSNCGAKNVTAEDEAEAEGETVGEPVGDTVVEEVEAEVVDDNSEA